MRKFLVAIFTLSSCGGNQISDEAEVRKVVTGYYDGIRLHNTDMMTDVTVPDFILYEAGKVWNNDSVFREMSKYKFTVDFTFSDFEISVNKQKAYATYYVNADFVFDDTIKQTLNFIENAAFEKTSDRWKMSLLQVCNRLTRYDTIHYAPDYLAARIAEFGKEPFAEGGIALLGNSLIEYGNWKKLLADSTVVNRGIAADNTFGVLKRIDEIISRKPMKLFLEIGINDLSQNIPLNVALNNIETIVNRIRMGSPATKIYVVSLLPTNDDVRNEYPDAFNKNSLAGIFNDHLEILGTGGSFVYLDLNARLRDADGNLDRKFAQPDGLHLNDNGYVVFASLLKALK